MPVKENGNYQLWLACRRLENSYRFTSDVLLSLMKKLEEASPKVKYVAMEAPGFTIDPWPIPPCIPGKTCLKTIEDLSDFNRRSTKYAVAFGEGLDDLYLMARDLGIKNLEFTPTQLPVPPEGGGQGGGKSGGPRNPAAVAAKSGGPRKPAAVAAKR